jgi:hypothetical protein
MAALTASAIVCYSIPTATNRFIVVVYMLRNRVWQQAFERLERPEGKLSWVVLRGLEASNDLRLPDRTGLNEVRRWELNPLSDSQVNDYRPILLETHPQAAA